MAKKFLDGSGTEHLIGKVKEKLSQAAYIEQDESQASIADFDPRTDTVWKKAQTLSSAEKAQVQQNIGISEWLNNLTGEKHESVVATDQTSSVTSLLPVTGEKDTIYRVGKWDGTQYNEEYYSDYAWDGTAYVQLNKKSIVGEVFDISEYHANAKYADLTAALGNDGENIPQSVRKGGMSVKYVQSSDNKYVQYRYMSSSTAVADFTNVANWYNEHVSVQQSVQTQKDAQIINVNDTSYRISDARFEKAETKIFKEVKYADNETITGNTSTTWSIARNYIIPLDNITAIAFSIATATSALERNIQLFTYDAQGQVVRTLSPNSFSFTSDFEYNFVPLANEVTVKVILWATNRSIIPSMTYTGVNIVATTNNSIEKNIEGLDDRVEDIESKISPNIIAQWDNKTFAITSSWQKAAEIVVNSNEYGNVRIKVNNASKILESNMQVFSITNGISAELSDYSIYSVEDFPYDKTIDIRSYDGLKIILWASNRGSSGTITYTGFEVSASINSALLQEQFKISAERGLMPKCVLPDNKDIYVTLIGSSIFQYFNSFDKAEEGVAEVPMTCEKQAAAYYLWKSIVFGNPKYRRFDYGKHSLVGDYCDKWNDDSNAFFNESGTWKSVYNTNVSYPSIIVTTKIEDIAPIYDGYQVPDLDSTRVTPGTNTAALRVEPIRMSNGSGASVSFKIPAGYSKCDFIYLASILGDSVTITTNRNNGVVKYSGEHNYSNASEANNAIFSTEFTPVTIGSRTIKGMPNEKISFFIEDTSIDTIITITKSSNTNKYIFYWGVSYWGTSEEPYALLFSNLSRGAMNADNFSQRRVLFENTTHPDVVLLQFALVNSFNNNFSISKINSFISTYNSMKSAYAQDGVDVAYIGTYIAPSQYNNASPATGIKYLWKSISKWLQDNELEYFGSADFIFRKAYDVYYSKEYTYVNWLTLLTSDNTHLNTLGYKVWKELFENLE